MRIIQAAYGSPEYDDMVRLRYEVLRQPLGLEFSPEELASEYDQNHLGLYSADWELYGCLVLKPLNPYQVKMRQVAIRSDLQNRGLGKWLILQSELYAKSLGFQQIECHARESAIPFYLKLGYTITSEEFIEVGLPHKKMEKRL